MILSIWASPHWVQFLFPVKEVLQEIIFSISMPTYDWREILQMVSHSSIIQIFGALQMSLKLNIQFTLFGRFY